ncbi:hypothetical protein JG688_00012863, partial [Phytophthora aleatoria]
MTIPTKVLLSGARIPIIGFGAYLENDVSNSYNIVLSALKQGYRHIHTAQLYHNEAEGNERALNSIKKSNQKIGLGYIDLFLLHAPGDAATRAETWRAVEELHEQDILNDIGVSNFSGAHIDKLMKTAKVKPAVNQIEVHPWLTLKGYKMRDPTLIEIANKVKATPAQVLVAFSLARDIVPLPKSANTKHQKENLEAVNVKLSAEQVERLLALDEYYVTDWDPIRDEDVQADSIWESVSSVSQLVSITSQRGTSKTKAKEQFPPLSAMIKVKWDSTYRPTNGPNSSSNAPTTSGERPTLTALMDGIVINSSSVSSNAGTTRRPPMPKWDMGTISEDTMPAAFTAASAGWSNNRFELTESGEVRNKATRQRISKQEIREHGEEVLRGLIDNVHTRMLQELLFLEQAIPPLDKNFSVAEKLLVFVCSFRGLSCGIWSRSVLLKDGVSVGSMLPYFQKAIAAGYGVLVMNPNMNTQLMVTQDGTVEKMPIRGSSNAGDHCDHVWRNYIFPSAAHKVHFIAYGYGGVLVTQLIAKYRYELKSRLGNVAFIESSHKIDPSWNSGFKRFFSQHSISWSRSDFPLNTELSRDATAFATSGGPSGTGTTTSSDDAFSATSPSSRSPKSPSAAQLTGFGCICLSAGPCEGANESPAYTTKEVLDTVFAFLASPTPYEFQ